jgi:hypothetical protein
MTAPTTSSRYVSVWSILMNPSLRKYASPPLQRTDRERGAQACEALEVRMRRDSPFWTHGWSGCDCVP